MTTPNTIHQPVMFDQVIDLLDPKIGKKYIDATIGGGGHTAGLLAHQASVLGIDQDHQAITHVAARFANHPHLTLVEANFITLLNKAKEHNFTQVDGVLFDLGVSSLQLDSPDRGFSFKYDSPLDMRMSQNNQQTATELINTMSEEEIYELLVVNSQEPKAREIAQAIIHHRPITTTRQLADLVLSVYGGHRHRLHPATKTFQAFRIAVNQELKLIKPALTDAFSLLKIGGRLIVISFHEGEDRIVKRTFLEFSQAGVAVTPLKQPLTPTSSEVALNPRARSAKLRLLERTQ